MARPKKKKPDPLIPLKYRSYCWAHLPPGDDVTMEDFVSFAKFFLCRQTKRLIKDPVWEKYTDEEILMEYFAHLFVIDEKAKIQFEADIDAGSKIYGEDVYEWLEKKVKENQEEMSKKLDEMPERITFSPDKNEDLEE